MELFEWMRGNWEQLIVSDGGLFRLRFFGTTCRWAGLIKNPQLAYDNGIEDRTKIREERRPEPGGHHGG